MSNKKPNRKISNAFAPQNRSKLAMLVGGAIALIAVGSYISNSGTDNIQELEVASNVARNENSKLQDDKLQLGKMTVQATAVKNQLYKEKVEEKLYNGETAIVERQNELEFKDNKPLAKLEVVQAPKIDVPTDENIVEVQEAKPIVIQESLEPTTTTAVRSLSYAASNRQQIEEWKALQAGTLKTIYDRRFQNADSDKEAEPTVEFTALKEYQDAIKNEKERQQAIADFKLEQEINQSVANTQTASTAFSPKNQAVSDSAKTSFSSSIFDEPIFRQGQRISAMTTLGASSVQLGPITAEIAEGEYAGAEIMGQVSVTGEALNFEFNTMWIPSLKKRVPINAIALSFDNLSVGTKTNINHKYFTRFFIKPALQGIGAAGQYYANDSETEVSSNSGVIVQSRAQKTAKTARKVAMGAAADALSQEFNDIDTTPEITQDRNTPIVLLFMQDVVLNEKDLDSGNATATTSASTSVDNDIKKTEFRLRKNQDAPRTDDKNVIGTITNPDGSTQPIISK